MLKASLPQLIDSARRGQVVSFPTDTIPALAVKPDQASEIYRLKQRHPNKPLILMAAKASDLWPYVRGSEAEQLQWTALTQKYWPGALTLVLPASGLHPTAMTPANPRTLGIRVPAHGLAQEILAATGPLATTSANRSGQPPIRRLSQIAEQFPQVQVLTSNRTDEMTTSQALKPSTVVAWQKQSWQILRQGAIALST